MKSWLANSWLMGAAVALALLYTAPAQAEGWLHAKDARIVDETGRPVLLRGMGLGGWMLQEGYMLKLGELGKGQHVIRAEDRQAGRPERERDPPGLARQPHHQGRHRRHGRHGLQLRAPADALRPADPGRRPGAEVPGVDTWKEDGFKRIDDLLAWTKANGMYLILDLHAAPSGQGNDLPIADRDPAKPSLWDSPRTAARPSLSGRSWPPATRTSR
jgi:endoglucanase